MNPSWVLSDDQRKKRFKKYREQKSGDNLSSPDSAGNELDDSQQAPVFPVDVERNNSGRRRVKSAPDRAMPGLFDGSGGGGQYHHASGGRGRGNGAPRKYGSSGPKSGVMGRSRGLGLHCGPNIMNMNGGMGGGVGGMSSMADGGPSPGGLATASQPVSPVDSICSVDFGQSNNSWVFPDVIKTEPDDNYAAFNSLKNDVQNGFVTSSPVKVEPDSMGPAINNGNIAVGCNSMDAMYDQMDNLNVQVKKAFC